MSKIKFVTDSASDISAADEQKYDILVIPFPVTFGDKTYLSRVEIDNETFYDLLEKAPSIPTTSQITVYQYGEIFEKLWKEEYTDVINVIINSEGSGTYNSACLAAEMFYETHPEAKGVFTIHNIDGQSYTCGYGYAVTHGAELAEAGATIDEILTFVNEWVSNSVIYFVMTTLKYAAKSGRIPSAAAFVGEVLGLKPVMRIHDHKIETNDKVRGEKKILPTIRTKVLEEIREGSPYVLIYGNTPSDADEIEKVLTEAIGYPPSGRSQIGAAVAANAGPRVVGACFMKK